MRYLYDRIYDTHDKFLYDSVKQFLFFISMPNFRAEAERSLFFLWRFETENVLDISILHYIVQYENRIVDVRKFS